MIITYIAWAVLFLGFYLLYSEYEDLPDLVPIKYNFNGTIQNEGPKSTLYVLVIVSFFVGLLMTGLNFMDGIEKTSLVLQVTHLVTQLLFTYIIYQTIRITKGEAKGLDNLFYILMIAVIVLPLSLTFLAK